MVSRRIVKSENGLGAWPSLRPGRQLRASRVLAAWIALFLTVASPTIRAEQVYAESFTVGSGGFLVTGVSSWQWGVPEAGPEYAHSPPMCWGTNLTGNYANGERGALLSPVIDLTGQHDRCLALSWWEWLECEAGYDMASVELTRDGGATWEAVHIATGMTAGYWEWRQVWIDPSFATAAFRFRFRFSSDDSIAAHGWYVDSVRLDAFAAVEHVAASFETLDDRPPELQLAGSWDVGVPTVGPASARTGSQVLGTVLDGFYGKNEFSVAQFAIPVPVAADGPHVLLMSWWEFLQLDGGNDRFEVAVSPDQGGTWTAVPDGPRLRPPAWLARHALWHHELAFDPDRPLQSVPVSLTLSSDSVFENAGAYLDDLRAWTVDSKAIDKPPRFLPPGVSARIEGHILADQAGQPHTFSREIDVFDPEDSQFTWQVIAPPPLGQAAVVGTGSTATVEYTPPLHWEGTERFFVQAVDAEGWFDTLAVDVVIERVDALPPPAPATPDLVPESDTGAADDDNLTARNNATPETRLWFLVADTVAGATVTLYAGEAPIGQAIAEETATMVPTDGTTILADGEHAITARQTVDGQPPSLPSAPLRITVDTRRPVLVRLETVAIHVGTAWWEPLAPGGTHCRANGLDKIRLTLDEPLDPASVGPTAVLVVDRQATAYPVLEASASGESIVLTLTPPPDGYWYTFSLTDAITDLAGNPVVLPAAIEVGALFGDANNDAQVDVGDLLAVRARLLEEVGGGNVRYDLNLDGRINVGDLLTVRGRDGASLE